jgi:HEAT repeat protein
LTETAAVANVARDPSRDVRIAVARGLASLDDAAAVPALAALADDTEPLVRAAALESAAAHGTPAELAERAVAAADDPSWEVRKSAAVALGAAWAEVAVPVLVTACEDGHIEVRKAAVRALARWAAVPEATVALVTALTDPDADVRAYARLAGDGLPM